MTEKRLPDCWKSEDSAAAFGEALVLAVLSRFSDMQLTDHNDKDDFDSVFPGLVTFPELGMPLEIELDGPRHEKLQLTEHAASAGISANILNRADGGIQLSAILGSLPDPTDSALFGAKLMLNDNAQFGIDLPAGFETLSLDAAERALCAIAAPTAAAVHFFGDTASPHHRRRAQAASAYPLFAKKLASDPSLQRLIDGSRPLGAALSDRVGLSQGHLRRLKQIQTPLPQDRLFEFGETARGADPLGIERSRRHSIGGDLSLDQLCGLLRNFPANWVPDSDTEWSSFVDVVSACALPISSSFGVSVHSILAAAKGDWTGYKATLARAYGMDFKEFDRRLIALATADAAHLVEEFNRTVVFPQLLSTIVNTGNRLPGPSSDLSIRGRKIAFQIIVGKAKNIPGSLLSAARNWAARIPALMEAEEVDEPLENEASAAHSDGKSWPALTIDFNSSNGLVVQNLASVEQLKEESRRLSHCVGRLYVRKSRNGNCHLFSIRTTDCSRSLSTIELSPIEDGPDRLVLADLEIRQHKAKNNRKPDKNAVAASQEWLAALRTGNHPADIKVARAWRKRQQETKYLEDSTQAETKESIQGKWKAALGRHWQNSEVRTAVWNEWQSHILRGELARARGPGFLYTRGEVRELLAALCPSTAKILSEQRIRRQPD